MQSNVLQNNSIIKNIVYAYLQCSYDAFLKTVPYFALRTSREGGSALNVLAARTSEPLRPVSSFTFGNVTEF